MSAMESEHTQLPNATKPLVPPKPKIVPLPRSRVSKTSTGTQVNLLRKSTNKPQILAKPVKIAGSGAERPSGNVQAVNADPESSESKTIIKREQKVYIHKTEVRKTSHTTVIVKPQIAPKPILRSKPQNVSFAPDQPTTHSRKGILKSVTRSNSAPVRRPIYSHALPNQNRNQCANVNNNKLNSTAPTSLQNEQIKNLRNSQLNRISLPIVFTGWKKSRTFPVFNNPHVSACPSRNQSFTHLKINSELLKSGAKPLAESNKLIPVPVTTCSSEPDLVPVPPPRLKRKPSILRPPNTAFDPPTIAVPLPIKTTPIYAKVNKSRKWAHRRNLRKGKIYNNENIEKTSLLHSVFKCDDEHDYEIIGNPTSEFDDELMDEVKELASEMVIKSKSPKSRAQAKHEKGPDERKETVENKPESGTKSFLHKNPIAEMGELRQGGTECKEGDNPPELVKTESIPAQELVDNKSFLFRIMTGPPDDANSCNAQLPEIIIDCVTDQTTPDNLLNNSKVISLGEMSPEDQADGIKETGSEEATPVVGQASPWEDINLEDTQPVEQQTCLDTDNELQISQETPKGEDTERTTPTNLTTIEAQLKIDNLSEEETDAIDSENPKEILQMKEKSKSKSSLLDFVDMEIQKVQHLLADIASGSSDKKKKPTSSLSLPTDVPKSVLLRKSSVPNLSSSLSEFKGSKSDDPQLSRRSWANKSTSSVGSTTSSSSLGSKAGTPGLTPPHCKGRRMSDVSQWFWADEGDTSTGAMGDNEHSPLHSSSEEIGFVESNSGRPLFRRRRTVADFFGKARKSSLASFVNASMVWKNNGRRKSKCTLEASDLPKIEVIFADNASSTESKESKRLSFVEDEEEVDLLEMRKKAEAERCEKILSRLSPKAKKAFYVVGEIVSSEQTFVDVLRLITIEFPKSLEKSAKRLRLKQGVISEPDLEFMLGGLPILKGVNEDLLQDLEERVSDWEEDSKIADIFVKKGAFLKHYTNYIKDFEKISRFFDNCRQKNSNFANAVREFEERKICHNLGIKPYMLKPVQRMPQYSLLLEDYLKHLDETHADFEDTKKAISIVRSVAEHANETIRVQAAWEQLILLQKRLPGVDFLSDNNGYLVKEGELLKVCRKELQPRYFVVMNDSLLCLTYMNTSTKDLKLKYKLPLTRMKIMVSVSQEHQFEFSIIGVARSFNVVAKSSRERDEWMEAMSNAINCYNKRRPSFISALDCAQKQYQLGKQAPIWIQDSRVSMCQACTTEFSMTFRRHHCRSCGKVVCRHCSANEAPLQYLDYETGRVCDSCYEFILNDFEVNYEDKESKTFYQIRQKFKKFNIGMTPVRKTVKNKRTVRLPSKIDEDNNSIAKLCSHLQWKEKKIWRRNWFVLIDRVLYIFAASDDVAAIKTLPVLGYTVEAGGSDDDSDKELSFKLRHKGTGVIAFQADNSHTAEKWIDALNEAISLKTAE